MRTLLHIVRSYIGARILMEDNRRPSLPFQHIHSTYVRRDYRPILLDISLTFDSDALAHSSAQIPQG